MTTCHTSTPGASATRSTRSARSTPRAPSAEPLEPRRLFAAVLHDEGVRIPDAPYFHRPDFLYFSASTANGVELWMNEGQPGTTHVAVTGVPGPASYFPRDVVTVRNAQSPLYTDLYFTGQDAAGRRALYKRDTNTRLVSVLGRFASIDQVVAINDTTLVFSADGGDGAGAELWKTDGTAAGTIRLSDLVPGGAGASISGMTAFNGRAYFSARDAANGAELWSTDGTAPGTALFKDINPGAPGSSPRDFLPAGSRLYFNATTADGGSELWSTDGTATGTVQALDARPGPGGSGLTPVLPLLGGPLYSFTRGDVPLELYKTDPATGLTTLVKRISEQSAGERRVSTALLPGSANGAVFAFAASDAATGLEPWRSDGTAAGTSLLEDINPGPADSLAPGGSFASIADGRAFFAATGPGGGPVLWTTTGTAATTQVATGPAGGPVHDPTHLIATGSAVFFAASASAGAPRTLWAAEQDAPVSTVNGTAFHDRDADGVREAPDVAVPGATVYADLNGDADPDPDEPAVRTGDDGAYTLPLEPGAYVLRVAAPEPGYATSYPAGGARPITVPPNSSSLGVDFGVYTTGAAHITIFNDLDGNGVQTGGEPPLAGRTVYDDANGNDRLDPGEIARVTGPDGVARFNELAPRQYRFRQVLPPGWTETGQIADPSVNANVISAGTVTAAAGSRQPPTTAVLTGTVYEDANTNRRRDPGEGVLEGRTVYLDADHDGAFDAGETTATTDANGVYTFNAPAPGRHYIRQVVPQGWTQTTPNGVAEGAWFVIASAGQTTSPLDFGVVHALPASISGEAYDDLDADGVRDAGEPALPGGLAYIDLDGNGLRGSGDPAVTIDAVGRYTLSNLPPGDFVIRYTPPPNYLQTSPGHDERGAALGQTVSLAPGEHLTGADFGAVSRSSVASVFFQVFEDRNGNGFLDTGEQAIVSNRVVYLDADNDGVLDPGERRLRTLNNGVLFQALAPGTYTFRAVTPDGYRQTFPNAAGGAHTVTLAAGQSLSTLHFGFTPAATASAIAGTLYVDNNGNGLRDANEPGRSGRVFLDLNNDGVRQATEPSVSATGGGQYSFTGLAAGTYTVRAEKNDTETRTQPASGFYTMTLGANQLAAGNDFGFIPNTRLGRVVGFVFDDTNGNGRLDTGETPPAGRTVWLDADDDGLLDPGEFTATQGIDGFNITNVLPGTYTLRVVVPPGMMQTLPAGGAGRVVIVGAGQTVSGGSFGLAVAPQDSTPPAVAGVFVSGSAWSQAFTSSLAANGLGSGGYAVPAAGAGRALPWTNADTIIVRFSEDVRLQAGDLRVIGVSGRASRYDAFSYDPATFTATWRLASPFRADRVRIEIDGDAPGGVTDAAGNLLYGAAGGTAPGDHVRTFNTLPGDATGDGRVNALDLALVKRRLNSTAAGNAAARYSAFCDVDGNGRINALDLAVVRFNLTRTLPPAPAIAAGIVVRRAGTTRDLYGTQPILPA